MQVDNRAMQIYCLPEGEAFPWTHLYLPGEAFDRVISTAHSCVVKAGEAFAAICCSAPLTAVTQGMTAGNEYRAQGHRVAWYIEVGHGDASDFDAFCQRMSTLSVRLDDSDTAVAATAEGELMRLDLQGRCQVEGVERAFPADAGCHPIVIYRGDAQ